MRSAVNPLFDKIAIAVAAVGLELVEVEASERGLLRVFIDKPGRTPRSRGRGITVDDCGRVSNHLSNVLVVENIAYERLEVSSPGVDRPLRRPDDFARYAGERARLRLVALQEGRKNLVGVLSGFVDGAVVIECNGKIYQVPAENIDRARLEPALAFRPSEEVGEVDSQAESEGEPNDVAPADEGAKSKAPVKLPRGKGKKPKKANG